MRATLYFLPSRIRRRSQKRRQYVRLMTGSCLQSLLIYAVVSANIVGAGFVIRSRYIYLRETGTL